MRRRFGTVILALVVGLAAGLARGADRKAPLKPFAVPRDRAPWEAKRADVARRVNDLLGLAGPRPAPEVTNDGPPQEHDDGVTRQPITIRGPGGDALRATVVTMAGNSRDPRQPTILFLGNGPGRPGDPLTPAFGDPPPAVTLARRGFLVLALHDTRTDPEASPWVSPVATADPVPRWGLSLRDAQTALDALASRPEVDARRIGVFGVGLAGTRAWWLTGLDERVACGVAAGGITRVSDWLAAQGAAAPPLAPWAETMLASFDAEAVMALCAPRPLQILGGERDPFAPASGFKVLRDTTRRAYAALGSSGPAYTLYGGQGAGFTLLEWDAALETFDKQFMPQGPNPLGHPPEPEPEADASWVDPAEHGLAGWAVEMSQRPGTWAWHDGVIACKPGPFEYGWLRLPVELADFLLRVEWRVPPKGNTGIFLRARPVDWTLPPNEANKLRVSALGLTWPSRTGLELQAQDDPGHADRYSSGSLYRHAAPSANPTKPPGEWNRYTVRCRGARVEVWCNGTQVLDTRLDSQPTLRHPPLSGYVGLQNHGAPAEFRNIRYRPLGREGSGPPP